MRKTVSLLLLLVTIASCKTQTLAVPACVDTASACAGTAANLAEADALIRRAEQEVRLALQTGFIWNDTETRLAEAKAAHTAGDLDTASRLARVAIDEAAQAQLQARAATKVKRDFTYRP